MTLQTSPWAGTQGAKALLPSTVQVTDGPGSQASGTSDSRGTPASTPMRQRKLTSMFASGRPSGEFSWTYSRATRSASTGSSLRRETPARAPESRALWRSRFVLRSMPWSRTSAAMPRMTVKKRAKRTSAWPSWPACAGRPGDCLGTSGDPVVVVCTSCTPYSIRILASDERGISVPKRSGKNVV